MLKNARARTKQLVDKVTDKVVDNAYDWGERAYHYGGLAVRGTLTGAIASSALTHSKGAEMGELALVAGGIVTAAAGAATLKRAFTHGARDIRRDNVAEPLSCASGVVGRSTSTFMAAAMATGLAIGTVNWENEDGILQEKVMDMRVQYVEENYLP